MGGTATVFGLDKAPDTPGTFDVGAKLLLQKTGTKRQAKLAQCVLRDERMFS